jgi:hypothetical protein
MESFEFGGGNPANKPKQSHGSGFEATGYRGYAGNARFEG